MTQAMQFTTDIAAGESVLQALQRETQLPDEVLLDAADKGAVWVNLQRGRGRTRPRRQRAVQVDIAEGSTVMLNYNPVVLDQVPLSMHCVSEHANYGIWFKPAGMLCQGSKWSDHTTATQVASGISGRQCHLVHRLDRAACGLLLIAYTRNALRAFTSLFEQRAMHKRYQASIEGKLNLTLPLTINTPIDGKSALTIVHEQRPCGISANGILSLSIETGRKHQIRKHLSQLGHPIVGDRLYGLKNDTPSLSDQLATENVSSNLQLVACGLRFLCPFANTELKVSIDADAALAGEPTS